MLTKSHLTEKQLCAITLGCEKQSDFPVFSWNVTFPDKPKPHPRPPQPPAVSVFLQRRKSINIPI